MRTSGKNEREGLMTDKLWTVLRIKPAYSRSGTAEIIRIIYNPRDESVKDIIRAWIPASFRHQVYGYKCK